RSLKGREKVERFVNHLQSVVEFSQVELQHGILRIPLDAFLVDPDNFPWFSGVQVELLQAVEDNHVSSLGIDLFKYLRRVLRLALANENLAQADVRGQESSVSFDGPAEIAAGLFRMSPLKELPTDLVGDSDQQARLGAPILFGKIGFHQAVLDFQRVAPLLQSDEQVAL